MSINESHLKSAIEELFCNLNTNSSEELFRAYTNRTYYYIFHLVKNILIEYYPQYSLSKKGVFKTGTHQNIVQTLEDLAQKSNNKDIKKLSIQFKYFLSKRHDADYDLEKNFHEYEFKQVKRYFETMPNLIQECLVIEENKLEST